MQPAHPERDTKLPNSGEESAREGEPPPRSAVRAILRNDGLRNPSEAPPNGRAGLAEPSARQRALRMLVSCARHELRAPLQAIQGFSDLLASEAYGALGGDQRVFVEHILQGSADLSRALDACFELVQAELLQPPAEPLRASVRKLLDEALAVAESAHGAQFERQFEALDIDPSVVVDLHDFAKAMDAIVAALAPLARPALLVSARAREGVVELLVRTGWEPRTFRSIDEPPRRNVPARALLWLRLASSLLARSDGLLEASESYDQVRVYLPHHRDD